MDEQMIELIARAIESGSGNPDTFRGEVSPTALRDARVAHSVIAGKVAELTEQRDALRSELEHERASRMHWQVRAALAPYPERRSE